MSRTRFPGILLLLTVVVAPVFSQLPDTAPVHQYNPFIVTTWLPVSREIAVSDSQNIYLYTSAFDHIETIPVLPFCARSEKECPYITHLSWSPNESYFSVGIEHTAHCRGCSGKYDYELQIRDGNTREILYRFENDYRSISWSPDSRYVVGAGIKDPYPDKTIHIIDAENGTIRRDFSTADNLRTQAAVWHPDAIELLVLTTSIQLWDTDENPPVLHSQIQSPYEGVFPEKAIYSPDGTQIAAILNNGASEQYEIIVWDRESGDPILSLAHPEEIRYLRWVDNHIVTTISYAERYIWNDATGELLNQFEDIRVYSQEILYMTEDGYHVLVMGESLRDHLKINR